MLALSVTLAGKAPHRKAVKPIAREWGNQLSILIIGGTGGTGRQLMKQALELGHYVTALTRKPAKLTIEHPKLRVIKGDVLDYESAESAMRGQNAVLCALGHKPWLYPDRILSEGLRNILRAMKICDVLRFVCETSLGIGNSVGRLGLYYTFFVIPLILPFYFSDKVRQEEAIAANDVDWVIVRPGILANGPARGKYRHGPNVGSFIWTRISRADVADLMLRQLTDDEYLGTAVGVYW